MTSDEFRNLITKYGGSAELFMSTWLELPKEYEIWPLGLWPCLLYSNGEVFLAYQDEHMEPCTLSPEIVQQMNTAMAGALMN